MIGLIVTGHGNFASGLTSALHVIAGPAENYVYCDFELNSSPEELRDKIEEAMKSLKDCDSILFLTDLVGGTPFKTAVELGYPKGYPVVAGTNLGMLIEINLVRQFMEDVNDLAKQAITVGKDQVQQFEMKTPSVQEDDFSDGI